MSGPKSSSYEVRRNRRLAELAREDALAHLRLAVDEWRRVVGTVDAARRANPDGLAGFSAGEAPAMPNENDATNLIQAGASAFMGAAVRVRDQLTAAMLRSECRQMMFRLSDGLDIDQGQVGNRAPQDLNPKAERGEKATSHAHKRQSRIDLALSRLTAQPDDVPPHFFANLAERTLAESSAARADLLIAELSACVQHANDRAEQRRRNRATAERLLAELHGLNDDAVSKVRSALQAIVSSGCDLTPELRERTTQAAIQARTLADRSYAAEVITNALGTLGYEVEEGFETVFVTGGVAHVQKPGWPDHLLRVRSGAGTAVIDFGLVRTRSDASVSTREQALRDREMEEHWCTDYERLQSEVERGGVSCETLRRIPPGAVPVPIENRPAIVTTKTRRHVVRTVTR